MKLYQNLQFASEWVFLSFVLGDEFHATYIFIIFQCRIVANSSKHIDLLIGNWVRYKLSKFSIWEPTNSRCFSELSRSRGSSDTDHSADSAVRQIHHVDTPLANVKTRYITIVFQFELSLCVPNFILFLQRSRKTKEDSGNINQKEVIINIHQFY